MIHTQKKMASLRTRFIALALILGSLLIIGTYISNSNSSKTSDEAFFQLSSISEQSLLVDTIRSQIFDANLYLNLYLISTDQTINKKNYSQSILSAQKTLSQLQAHPDIKKQKHNNSLKNIKQLIHELDNKIQLLFKVRVTPTLQYPAMNIAFSQMQPNGNIIAGAISIAVEELENNHQLSNTLFILKTFFNTQYTWTTLTSEFRIYLANRMGSFDETGLRQQEINIEHFYSKFMQNIAQLKILDRDGKLDFEASNSVNEILTSAHKWKSGFNQVKTIHNSEHWRTDSLIMHDEVIPKIVSIFSHLDQFEYLLKDQDKEIVRRLTNSAKTKNIIFSSIMIFFILYILSALISIERMVFKPIAAIANILKSKDINDHNELQKYARTSETKKLVDAYQEMQQQVLSRQKELEYQTLHDDLTGLPNRVKLKERINYHLSIYKRNKNKLALFILDLDKFKEVNDTLGHHIGDELLIQVGKRFTKLLRENDTIARLGGDEFAVLLPETNAIQAINVAEKINESIDSTFSINEHKLHIGVSIGISIYPRDGEDIHTLMQHADVAMYVAKKQNRNYSHYNPEEDENSIDRLSLVSDLKKALKNNDLELYYQPKIALENNKVTGAEALLRWKHPTFGFVNPENIIELAEQVGLINDLTDWIINQAIAYCSHCHQSGYPINVSINLSVQNLRNHKMCVVVSNCLEKYQMDSKHIILEITESAMMSHPERSLDVLNAFSKMGVYLSIDDFGTGFSSLAYLKKFPVNELKIDKSFVMEVDTNKSDDVIVRSTIELGHNLGLNVVAEGVEHVGIYNSLQELGCDTIQGYLVSKPLDQHLFFTWLENHFDKNLKESRIFLG
ncbi:MAG: EAL domain-containing protein [Gammaproteobacteria bacterium]|nr:EAL domain-containing protein [Gammaproteobacteria bacterium]